LYEKDNNQKTQYHNQGSNLDLSKYLHTYLFYDKYTKFLQIQSISSNRQIRFSNELPAALLEYLVPTLVDCFAFYFTLIVIVRGLNLGIYTYLCQFFMDLSFHLCIGKKATNLDTY
jgi:hypothetical protein